MSEKVTDAFPGMHDSKPQAPQLDSPTPQCLIKDVGFDPSLQILISQVSDDAEINNPKRKILDDVCQLASKSEHP